MFTGIIETIGKISSIEKEGSNVHLKVGAEFASELKVDQSVAHNGVCLTVVSLSADHYTVTAIDETLQRSNLGVLRPGDRVNLERAMVSGTRLDGHMVQGHVDQTARCSGIEEKKGSWLFQFEFIGEPAFLVVEKGSICIDGVSLTIAAVQGNGFSVAIIPYTYEHTIFQFYKTGDTANIEFDVIGKYVHQYMEHYRQKGQLK